VLTLNTRPKFIPIYGELILQQLQYGVSAIQRLLDPVAADAIRIMILKQSYQISVKYFKNRWFSIIDFLYSEIIQVGAFQVTLWKKKGRGIHEG